MYNCAYAVYLYSYYALYNERLFKANFNVHLLVGVTKTVGRVANSVDPDQTPRSVASDLGLLCLLRPICPNTLDK